MCSLEKGLNSSAPKDIQRGRPLEGGCGFMSFIPEMLSVVLGGTESRFVLGGVGGIRKCGGLLSVALAAGRKTYLEMLGK